MQKPFLFLSMLYFVPFYSQAIDLSVQLRGDSSYVTEGVNNLNQGGIFWTGASLEHQGFTSYLDLGRADQVNYKEMKAGFTYNQAFVNDLSLTLGYERAEIWGDERQGDNYLNITFDYSALKWLTPEAYYSYSTSNKGYFVQLSLISHWELSGLFSIEPYASQIFDFGSINENTRGANNFEIGVGANFQLNKNMTIGGTLAHSFAQKTLKEAGEITGKTNLDETYAGINMNLSM